VRGEENSCFHVSDWNESSVYKVDLRVVGKHKWNGEYRQHANILSINKTCNVIVACFVGDTIEEYTPSVLWSIE